MSLSPADQKELFDALRADAPRFGEALARTAYARGLAVTKKEDGSTRPIPVTATPVVIDAAELARRQALAARISSATLKLSRWVLTGERAGLVLDGLSPLERELAKGTFARLSTLVTTRVDFFVGKTVSALEVNATIPAMQGYSDIAATTFLEEVGRAWGAPEATIAGWQAQNGSNAQALCQALLAGYRRSARGRRRARIALLCRRNDAQLTEQRYLCERFREWGADADVVYPDELSGDDAVRANGKTYELVYRHLFVRRLEETDLRGADYVKRAAGRAQRHARGGVEPARLAGGGEGRVRAAVRGRGEPVAGEGRGPHRRRAGRDRPRRAVDAPLPRRGAARDASPPIPIATCSSAAGTTAGGRSSSGRTRHEPGFAERVKAAYGEALDWNAAVRPRRGRIRWAAASWCRSWWRLNPSRTCCAAARTRCPPSCTWTSPRTPRWASTPQPQWGGVCRGSLVPHRQHRGRGRRAAADHHGDRAGAAGGAPRVG